MNVAVSVLSSVSDRLFPVSGSLHFCKKEKMSLSAPVFSSACSLRPNNFLIKRTKASRDMMDFGNSQRSSPPMASPDACSSVPRRMLDVSMAWTAQR